MSIPSDGFFKTEENAQEYSSQFDHSSDEESGDLRALKIEELTNLEALKDAIKLKKKRQFDIKSPLAEDIIDDIPEQFQN